MGISAEPERFYNPELGRPSEANVHLVRDNTSGFELWRLGQRIAYEDRELGEIVVPRSTAGFTTDLTSVPQLLTWLVSKSGTHLPAALVHDALTPPFSETDAAGNPLPDWIGPDVTRLQADRVFRDAMADVGTPPIKRWLIWSGVSIPTAWTVNKMQAIAAWASLVVIGIVGWLATLDLFDQIDLAPWMGAQPWNRELISGGIFAILIPLPIGLFA